MEQVQVVRLEVLAALALEVLVQAVLDLVDLVLEEPALGVPVVQAPGELEGNRVA